MMAYGPKVDRFLCSRIECHLLSVFILFTLLSFLLCFFSLCHGRPRCQRGVVIPLDILWSFK